MPNTYSQIYLHIIFSPKSRESLILPDFEDKIYQYISGIIKKLDQNLIQINGMKDHIHLLVRLKPAIAPSIFVQKIKSNSSKWINEQNFIDSKFSWQSGGGIFSIDYRRVSKVSTYIKNQKEHHSKKTFKEEYLDILKAYDIDYNDEYLIDFF